MQVLKTVLCLYHHWKEHQCGGENYMDGIDEDVRVIRVEPNEEDSGNNLLLRAVTQELTNKLTNWR